MDSSKETSETLKIINRVLPNIQSYLCNVLKNENLSLEAEALRARYETMLLLLEKPSVPSDSGGGGGSHHLQRYSMTTTTDRLLTRGNTLPSRRRTESEILAMKHGSMDGLHGIPERTKPIPELTGSLLWKDDHQRWHKRNCRLKSQQRTLSVYETADDEKVILVISLAGATYVSSPPDCDKDLCFGISVPTTEISILNPDPQQLMYTFAAYSEVDLTKWQTAIENIVTGQLATNGVLSSSSLGHDSVFSGGKQEDDVLGPFHGRPPEPLPFHDSDADEGNQSDCTIYEDIDELVQQFDLTMKATAQAMSEMSPKKPKKKRKKSFFPEKTSTNKVLSERKSKLEVGDYYTGYMHKRTGSSWKKKWCQLKGCIFSYSKTQSDLSRHEHILLRAEISIVKDVKKPFAFRLACKGVREVFFATDTEDNLSEWVSRLQSASKRSDDLTGLVNENGGEEGGDAALPEGIYNVPRNMLFGDTSIIDNDVIPIAGGIYDVPRALLENGNQGMDIQMTGNPFDIYDVPRSNPSPEDDTIYDYPLDFDLGDMEIYDYPPDAAQLEEIINQTRDSNSCFEYPIGDIDSSSHSHTPGSADGTISSTSSYRQSGSMGSSEDIPGAASFFGDGYRSLPHTKSLQVESFLSSIANTKPINNNQSLMSSLEFGQTVLQGNLLRKERLKWSQCFCLIRNSFLECHKTNNSKGKPLLKLLLLGSQVSSVQDSKKQWVFQLKHPRRDGVLTFAADNGLEFKNWTEAFKNASSIQVQQVNTMEDIRISDSDLKKQWKSVEKNVDNEHHDDVENKEQQDEDKKKRQRKSIFGRSPQRKNSRKSRNQSEFFNIPNDIDGTQSLPRSVSMELVTRPTDSTPFGPQIASRAHRAISPEGQPCFQGYLRLKTNKDDKWSRLWCLFEDMAIKCFTSQRNLTVVKQVSLRGCTIAQADSEARRKYTFRVWNSTTSEACYFSAAEEDEYHSWVKEVTKSAVKQTIGSHSDINDISTTLYYYPIDHQPIPQITTELPSPKHINSHTVGEGPSLSKPFFDLPGVTHHGPLKKRSDKGTWNVRYCRLRDNCLYVYYTGSDQTPITVLAVKHCKVEHIKLPPEECTEEYTFIVAVKAGKTHMFAAADDQDIQLWLRVLQDCVQSGSPSTRPRSDSKGNRTQSPLLSSHSRGSTPSSLPRRSDLVNHMPAASSLVDSIHSGYCEILQIKGAWSRAWCVLNQNCLYVYQSKESKSSIRTLALQGYKVEHVSSPDRQFVISLSHQSNPGLFVSASNQTDMLKWFEVLDAELSKINQTESTIEDTTSTPPHKQENTIEANKEVTESFGLMDMSVPEIGGQTLDDDESNSLLELGQGPLNITQYKEKCKIVVTHFEKRIKKTRKMANQTEDSLKKQREQLSTLKEKFLEHIERLKTSPNETETSQKKMKEMEVKFAQISKILPYLEKYMQANRQAEMQTLAILKEGCTVKLQQLESRYRTRSSSMSVGPQIGKLERRMSMPADTRTSPGSSKRLKKIVKEKQVTVEETQSEIADTSTTLSQPEEKTTNETSQRTDPAFLEEPAYAEVGHMQKKHSREPSLPENYVKLQLNQHATSTINQSPGGGVEYSTVQVNPKNRPAPSVPDNTPDTTTSLPLSNDTNTNSQDRGLSTANDKLLIKEEIELEKHLQCESPNSPPLTFTSIAGGFNDNDEELTISLNTTSSETSFTVLDTVIEEDPFAPYSPATVITPILVSPTPFNHHSHIPETLPSAIAAPTPLSSSLPSPPPSSPPPPTPPPLSSLPSPPTPTPPPPSSLSSAPPPSPPALPPPPPSPPLPPTLPLPSPPPPTPPLSLPPPPLSLPSPPPPPSQASLPSPLPQNNESVSSSNTTMVPSTKHSSPESTLLANTQKSTVSLPSRPAPPPVMRKTKSPNKQLPNNPPSPNKTFNPPPVYQKPVKRQVSPVIVPPPVKTKPKRHRNTSSNSDNPDLYSRDNGSNMSNEGSLTIAQKIKAFQ